jgi:signal transduction histidine kinase
LAISIIEGSFQPIEGTLSTLGRLSAPHIGATAGLQSSTARRKSPVLARIAKPDRTAKDVDMRALRIAASLVALATAAIVVLLPFEAANVLARPHDWPAAMYPFIAIAALAPATVGLLIALRRPRNGIAWILLVSALTMAALAQGLFLGREWATHFDDATWPVLYAGPIALAFLFPNGRLLSPRWRWVAALAVVSFAGFVAFALSDPSPTAYTDDTVKNPIAHNAVGEWFVHNHLGWIWVPLWFGMLASLFAGAIAVILRFRRSTGIERLQMLWLAWAAALFPITLVACGLSGFVITSFFDYAVAPALLLGWAAVAIAIGIAVTRYRLYAIERLVNRTVVYTIVTLLLAGTYILITLGLGVLAGRGSAWVTAAATLTVAVAFRPLRARVQSRVDRRFDRARFEAVQQVMSFEDGVREDRRAPEEIGEVLAGALRDPTAELLFWLPASEVYATAAGAQATLPDDGRAQTAVVRDGNRTGTLLHDPVLLQRRALLDGVLAAAGLSIEIARLRVEVRRQLAEVEASRRRIVEAGYEERRRLERDLHDGAQQRLVTLGIVLRRLQRSLPREAGMLAPAFDSAVDEIAATVTDLRTIAAGVRPPRLDDGLAAALRDLARGAPLPVEVEAPVDRVAPTVEAAAYFVACEALTNAVKHAAASRVALRAVRENGSLLVSVSDDGVGGAVARRGSGLAGLRDRVAAHGGVLEITSPAGGGTRVEVTLPCES